MSMFLAIIALFFSQIFKEKMSAVLENMVQSQIYQPDVKRTLPAHKRMVQMIDGRVV